MGFNKILPRSMCFRHSACLCGVYKRSLSWQSLLQMLCHPMNRKADIPSILKEKQVKTVSNKTIMSDFQWRMCLFHFGRSHALTSIVHIRGQAVYHPSKLSLQVTSITWKFERSRHAFPFPGIKAASSFQQAAWKSKWLNILQLSSRPAVKFYV